MVSSRGAKQTIGFIVLLLFVSSILLKVSTGIDSRVAFFDTALSALQVSYYGIPMRLASTSTIFAAKVIDTLILPLLALLLASIFIEAIKGFDIREKAAMAKIKGLKGHVIIAPFNRQARILVDDLKKEGINSVIIAKSKRELESIYNHGVLGLAGDARSSESFVAARIDRALGAVACSWDDTENAMISITARSARKDVMVLSVVNSEENKEKMRGAGASVIITPESTAGDEIARKLMSDVYTKRSLKK